MKANNLKYVPRANNDTVVNKRLDELGWRHDVMGKECMSTHYSSQSTHRDSSTIAKKYRASKKHGAD